MSLSEYEGRTLPGGDATIAHVVRHCRWKPEGSTWSRCRNCDAELDLSERHVLVAAGRDGSGDRYHLCDDGCVAGWLDAANGVEGGSD
jgi:hypothetical protein